MLILVNTSHKIFEGKKLVLLLSFDGYFSLVDSLYLEESSSLWIPRIKRLEAKDTFGVNFEARVVVLRVTDQKRVEKVQSISDLKQSRV